MSKITERPKITDCIHKESTVPDVIEIYNKSPEMYCYINKLDRYVDYLEDLMSDKDTKEHRISEINKKQQQETELYRLTVIQDFLLERGANDESINEKIIKLRKHINNDKA